MRLGPGALRRRDGGLRVDAPHRPRGGEPRRPSSGGARRPVRHALLRPAGRGDGGAGRGSCSRSPGGRGDDAGRPRPTRGSGRCSWSRDGSTRPPRCSTARSPPRAAAAPGVALKIALTYRGVRALLADRVRGRRGHQRRGPVESPPSSATASTRSPPACSWASRARTSGASRRRSTTSRRPRARAAQRRPVLAAAPHEPPRLGAPRARRPRPRPRVRHRGRAAGPGAARAGPRGRGPPEPLRRRRPGGTGRAGLRAPGRAPGAERRRARGCAG